MTGKYTAHQLAMELGVSDSTVSRALSGKGQEISGLFCLWMHGTVQPFFWNVWKGL